MNASTSLMQEAKDLVKVITRSETFNVGNGTVPFPSSVEVEFPYPVMDTVLEAVNNAYTVP